LLRNSRYGLSPDIKFHAGKGGRISGPHNKEGPESSHGAVMRILLAEDDEALATFVRKGLEAEHYAVDVSRDGEQALGLALGFDYDLVILDLSLPRLDGVLILQGIRKQKGQLPILILTARQRVEDRVRCLDAGADDYVVKPFSFAELSARIRALLRRGRLPGAPQKLENQFPALQKP